MFQLFLDRSQGIQPVVLKPRMYNKQLECLLKLKINYTCMCFPSKYSPQPLNRGSQECMDCIFTINMYMPEHRN